MQRGQGRGEIYREACLIIRDIGDLDVGVNVMSLRINVWATSRQVSRRAAEEIGLGTHQPVPRKEKSGAGAKWQFQKATQFIVPRCRSHMTLKAVIHQYARLHAQYAIWLSW